MKKTLLAAALLAGFATAGVAQAETSVTMYGILDTGYGYQNFDYDHGTADKEATTSGLRSGIVNGNRWGVKGSEDLGDGLRAIFQLEAGFNIGTGAQDGVSVDFDDESARTNLFNRQAFVGLSSDSWGTFTMGRQYNIADSFLDVNTSHSLANKDATFGASSYRIDNMFKYVSPSFSGFKLGLGYGNPDTAVTRSPEGDDRTNAFTSGIQYANGPLLLAATYDRVGASGNGATGLYSTSTDNTAVTNWALAGSYDFEVVKLELAFSQDRNGKIQGISGNGLKLNADDVSSIAVPANKAVYDFDGFKANNYFVGLEAPLGGGTLGVSYQRSTSNLDDYNTGFDDANTNIYGAKYIYPLSKRTSIYAYAAHATGISYIDDYTATEAGLGLNHKF